jgi:negative regulator of flagellin synthesis FlgM
MANSPVVDSAKVAEVKQAISDGRFQVHAEKVADSLIQSVQQMLQAQRATA